MTISAVTADTQHSPLLEAVIRRLRDTVQGLNDRNTFETDEPIPPEGYFPTGEVCCTVCLQDGRFDAGMYDGGGPNQLQERLALAVTVLRRSKIDQPPRIHSALQDDGKGLLRVWKLNVLRALLVENIEADPILVPWQPVDADGHPILRGMGLVPQSCEGPRTVNADWIGFTLRFEVPFDWDLRLPAAEDAE